jgi:hypothetical protein
MLTGSNNNLSIGKDKWLNRQGEGLAIPLKAGKGNWPD